MLHHEGAKTLRDSLSKCFYYIGHMTTCLSLVVRNVDTKITEKTVWHKSCVKSACCKNLTLLFSTCDSNSRYDVSKIQKEARIFIH